MTDRSWYLKNVRESQQACPNVVLFVPSDEDLKRVKRKDYIKLVFVGSSDNDLVEECLWVMIESKTSNEDRFCK